MIKNAQSKPNQVGQKTTTGEQKDSSINHTTNGLVSAQEQNSKVKMDKSKGSSAGPSIANPTPKEGSAFLATKMTTNGTKSLE